MQMFEYVIVLTSIVIGLALTHLMQGIAGLVQHPNRARIWWVHLACRSGAQILRNNQLTG